MGFILAVEAGITMMSRAPITSCPRDPRAQTHKQIPCFHARGNTRNVCEKMISIVDIAEPLKITNTIQDPDGGSEAGGREGWRDLTPCTQNKKKSPTHFTYLRYDGKHASA